MKKEVEVFKKKLLNTPNRLHKWRQVNSGMLETFSRVRKNTTILHTTYITHFIILFTTYIFTIFHLHSWDNQIFNYFWTQLGKCNAK